MRCLLHQQNITPDTLDEDIHTGYDQLGIKAVITLCLFFTTFVHLTFHRELNYFSNILSALVCLSVI